MKITANMNYLDFLYILFPKMPKALAALTRMGSGGGIQNSSSVVSEPSLSTNSHIFPQFLFIECLKVVKIRYIAFI